MLEGGAVLGHRAATESNWYGLTLEVDRLEIDAKSRVDASRMGYLPGRGGGNSSVGGATRTSGGSYGGLGGMGLESRTGCMGIIVIRVNRELERGRIIREVREVA